MDSAAYAQAKGHFWWWQVQDSNLGRRSRRFYRPPIITLHMAVDLRECHSRRSENGALSAICPCPPGTPGQRLAVC